VSNPDLPHKGGIGWRGEKPPNSNKARLAAVLFPPVSADADDLKERPAGEEYDGLDREMPELLDYAPL
jgi:hypothetical protein